MEKGGEMMNFFVGGVGAVSNRFFAPIAVLDVERAEMLQLCCESFKLNNAIIASYI